MRIYKDENAKYVKRKKSNISKAREKSKHKHTYIPCLVLDQEHGYFHTASYCKECGKIGNSLPGDVDYEAIHKGNYTTYKHLTPKELRAKYPEYPIFELNSYFQKYVDFTKTREEI